MVWFDLDETLCDHTTAGTRALLDLRAEDPLWRTVPEASWLERYRAINDALWERLRRNMEAWEIIRRERFRRLLAAFGFPTDRLEWMAEHYLDLYIARTRLVPGALETVQLLCERGWRCGIITDGSARVQHRKIELSGLGALVDPVVTPDDAKAFKPEPRIFQYAARIVGLEPFALLYVGDSWENDVVGARNSGWSAVWVSTGPDDGESASARCRDDRVQRIRRIADLPALLPR